MKKIEIIKGDIYSLDILIQKVNEFMENKIIISYHTSCFSSIHCQNDYIIITILYED